MPDTDVREWINDGRYGTGALYRPEDPRNYDMRRLPGVGAILPSLPAEDTHLAQYLGYTYDQGASPSCVWHAISGIQTGNEKIERRGEQLIFDAMAMHLATGPANEGRYTGDMLRIAQDQGTKLAASTKRYRVGSYAFAPKGSQQEFVDTFKAAVVAGYICGVALRLPSNFSAECSGTVMGWNTYHETIACGFRSTPGQFGSLLGKNSWSDRFGDRGFYWIPFDLLLWNNWQEGACFINTITDAIDDDLAPPPNPQPPDPPKPKRYVVTATATGTGMDNLRQGMSLVASGGGYSGNLGITGVQVYDDVTPPQPGTLAVTGYSKNPVKPGESFNVLGQGFGSGGNVFVSWVGQSLPVTSRTDTSITTTAPTSEGTAPVVVRVEAAEATGPALTISSGVNPPDPPDPGNLKIDSQVKGSGLYVWVRDAAGVSVAATVTVKVGEIQLMSFNKHTANNVPATFLVGRNHGTAQIQATTDDGIAVSGTAQV